MKKENTIQQNVEFLLMMYKRELEHAKKDTTQDCEFGYDKDQFIEDVENIIVELETILELNEQK